MNRFSINRESRAAAILNILPFLLVLGFLIFFSGGTSLISDTADEEQCKNLETALRRDIVQCYAIEGAYPPSLAYIEENYGFFYDSDRFYIDYTAIGANIMPDVTILPKAHDS